MAAATIDSRLSASRIIVGRYTGDGNATQTVTGLGAKPEALQIWADRTDAGALAYQKILLKTRSSTTTFCTDIMNGNEVDDAVRSLDDDGFTVGDEAVAHPNENTQVYKFIAWL